MKKTLTYFLSLSLLLLMFSPVVAQKSGTIWIKTYKPGSANYNDETIDKKALAFLDSLMKRDDIVVTFLGAADTLKWKGLPKNSQFSTAFDQAKKLERALELRKRYGKGNVGITDEPIRGVKVIWGPKPPDVFELKNNLDQLLAVNDSLANMVSGLSRHQNSQLSAIKDSLYNLLAKKTLKDKEIEPTYLDWEIKTGFVAWSAGAPYDLAVPSVGISLKRQYWAFEIGGGFTPWSREDVYGRRGDAILMGIIALYPRKTLEYRVGVISGWEYLTNTDNWTMKVLGLTAGPSIKWKIFEGFVGYTVTRLSTLTKPDHWVNGILIQVNFKFLI